MFKILLTVMFFLMKISLAVSQDKIYQQKEIDTFRITPNTPDMHEEFKKMLRTNTVLTGWLYYYRKKNYYHLSQKEYDSVLYYSEKAINVTENNNLPRIELQQLKDIYLYTGIAQLQYGNYKESTTYLLKALDAKERFSEEPNVSDPYIYGYLASNYIKMGNKEKALYYRLQVCKDSIFMSLPVNSGATYNRIGLLYEDKNKKDSALYFYRKALKIYKKSNNYAGLRGIYNNIGSFYKENNRDSTLYYYKLSKNLLDKYPDENYYYSKYFTLSNYGYVLVNEGKPIAAIKMLSNVLDSVYAMKKVDEEVKDLSFLTIDNLIEAYINNGQPYKAIEVAREKVKIFEQFHQQILEEKLRELEISHEVKEKDKSIMKLEATTTEQRIIIHQQNVIGLVLGILIVAIIGIGALILKQRKLKAKYETVNLEQRLLRSQLNPHFIFNALNTVSSLVHKQSDHTISYINKLAGLIRLILKNSREEFVSLQDELKSIENYLQLQSNFSQKFSYVINIDSTIDTENIFIPPMFIQPFIENSIAHGLRGVDKGNIKIDIEINSTDKLMHCKIIDNGIGVTKSLEVKNRNGAEYGSFSGKILKERLTIYSRSLNRKADYTVKNVERGKGTEVDLSLPFIEE